MGKVTIRHVAERAGVSTSTVSRTLHNHPRISEETKRRVMQAVRELEYRTYLTQPDEPVRTLGLVFPHGGEELFAHSFFVQVLRGISSYAQGCGFLTTFAFSSDQTGKLEFLEHYAASTSVRGVVLLSAHQHDPAIDLLCGTNTPFSVIGRPENPGDLLWVDNDNFHAMYDVVNRLMEQGARRIVFIGGLPHLNVTRDRLEGYRLALQNRGLELPIELIGYANEFTTSAGYRVMQGILTHDRPDAIVATDDLLACGALDAVYLRGLDLPCVGFNNSFEARHHSPPLSSVEIQPRELGRHAARLVIERIEGRAVAGNHVIVSTSFVQRASTEPVNV
jgi:DNA-binding LacI/PurR family transcriptional regulator